jgi:hypothetical protein
MIYFVQSPVEYIAHRIYLQTTIMIVTMQQKGLSAFLQFIALNGVLAELII